MPSADAPTASAIVLPALMCVFFVALFSGRTIARSIHDFACATWPVMRPSRSFQVHPVQYSCLIYTGLHHECPYYMLYT